MNPKFDILLEALYERPDDERIVRSVAQELRADPALREHYRQDLYVRTLLREWAQENQAATAGTGRTRRRLRFGAPLALAASLLAALGIGLWLNRDRLEPLPGAAIARVESAQGSVFGFADAAATEPRPLRPGDEILPGMRIETGADSAATLAWLDKTAQLALAESSVLSMPAGVPSVSVRASSVSLQKRMVLHQGALTATVAQQPTAQPFEAETPHARATVLGTRFRLNVKRTSNIQQGTSNVQGDSTWLSVDDGRVRFARLADEAAIEVAAGEFAVAGANAEDFALKAYPADTEWIDGRVIFEDDFSDGLKHWTLGQRRVNREERYEHEEFYPQGLCRIEPKQERIRGRDTHGILMKQGNLKAKTSPYNIPMPFMLLNRPITAQAFSIEWEYRLDARGEGSEAGPTFFNVSDMMSVWTDADKRHAGVKTDKRTRDMVNRSELIPLGDTNPPYRWKFRSFHNGELHAVTHVNFDAEKIGFLVRFGEAFVARCTIRELVPVPERPVSAAKPDLYDDGENRYRIGRLLFEDRFGNGLAQWETGQYRMDGTRVVYSPFPASGDRTRDSYIVAVRDFALPGREPIPAVIIQKGAGAAANRAIFIRLARDIEAPAYRIEWEYLASDSTACRGINSVTWGVELLNRAERMRRGGMAGSDLPEELRQLPWLTRMHVTPLRDKGRFLWNISDARGSSWSGGGRELGKEGFKVARGQVVLLRCTIHELVPVSDTLAQGE